MQCETGHDPATWRIQGSRGELRWREVIQAWSGDAAFNRWFSDQLAACPWQTLRWETPALTTAQLEQPFECVVMNAPDLAGRPPDPVPFAQQLALCSTERPVITFANLGGDAQLVVPGQLVAAAAYTDLAAFCREAPASQRDALWRAAAKALSARLGDRPVWLSVAGGGVAWLHLRLDDYPKYYHHGPYRHRPD